MLLPNETAAQEWQRGDYILSTDRDRLDLEVIHRFLSQDSYWARGISRALVERAVRGCLPFGIYLRDGTQVGFARVVTDCALFAYLRDVFVLPQHRGKGLATWLAVAMRKHPDLAHVVNWMLATRDAHEIYRRAGFGPLLYPQWTMQIAAPEDMDADRVRPAGS